MGRLGQRYLPTCARLYGDSSQMFLLCNVSQLVLITTACQQAPFGSTAFYWSHNNQIFTLGKVTSAYERASQYQWHSFLVDSWLEYKGHLWKSSSFRKFCAIDSSIAQTNQSSSVEWPCQRLHRRHHPKVVAYNSPKLSPWDYRDYRAPESFLCAFMITDSASLVHLPYLCTTVLHCLKKRRSILKCPFLAAMICCSLSHIIEMWIFNLYQSSMEKWWMS